jgi:hypothetical protein
MGKVVLSRENLTKIVSEFQRPVQSPASILVPLSIDFSFNLVLLRSQYAIFATLSQFKSRKRPFGVDFATIEPI